MTRPDWSRFHARFRPVILARDGYRCQIAGPDCESPDTPLPVHRLEVDHVKPRNLGGTVLDPSNMQTACKPCHNRKSALEAGKRPPGRERRRSRPPSNSDLDLTIA